MLKAENITKIYGKENEENRVIALSNINLEIEEGEFLGIVGASGSGKSTLLNLLGALDLPTSGDIYLDGECISKMKDDCRAKTRLKKYGFVFQSFYLEPNFTVLKNTVMPLIIDGMDKKEREKRGCDILDKLGLTDKINKKTNEISGGQMQRVSIARALVHKPKIVFADEPTGNLDSVCGDNIIDIFRKIANEGASVVMVTHNELQLNKCDRIIRISDGKII